MAVTLRALYEALNNKIPASLSCPWDNDGMMCAADPDMEITKVYCALDATDRVIDEAMEEGCNVIITHHPMIFHKLGGIDPLTPAGRRIALLMEKKIAVLSFHTRMDAMNGGVNDLLCETLHLCVTGTFGTDGEAIGRMGEFETPTEFATFCQQIKAELGSPVLHCVSARKPVKRVAVLGGDGKDDWEAALAAGADTYLTGTMSYNGFLDAKSAGLNVIAAGHFFTEVPMMDRVADWVEELFPELEAVVCEVPCEVLTV